MTLYEIDQRLLNTMRISDTEAVDTETGEVIDIDEIEHLEMAKDEKIENIIKWFLNLQNDAESLKAESDKFAKRAKSAKNKAEQLKNYLTFIQNGEKYKTSDGLHQITFRTTKSVEVTNINELPDCYLRVKDPEADKVAIKEAINKGIDVKGAVLVEKFSASIK